jgi:hypothetical protein
LQERANERLNTNCDAESKTKKTTKTKKIDSDKKAEKAKQSM